MKMFDCFGRSMFPKFSFAEDEGGVVDNTLPADNTETPPLEGDNNNNPSVDDLADKTTTGDNSDYSNDNSGDWHEEYEKKGPEGIVKEARRMREKIAKLEAEVKAKGEFQPEVKQAEPKPAEKGNSQPTEFDPIAYLSKNERGKTSLAHFKRMGMDDEGIRALIDTIGILSNDISRSSVEPIASEFREGRFTRALDSFSKDDNFKFGMSKPEIKKDMEAYIRNTFKPELWTDKEVMQSAYGLALSKHPEIFTQGKREIIEGGAIHEKGDGNSGKMSNGISDMAIIAYAEEIGYKPSDLQDKSVKASVIEAYKARQKAQQN